MSKLPLGSVFKIVLETKSSKKFLVGTILSFSFSMAVILCTVGLMDGFELTLKQALATANGDIKVTSGKGFFISDAQLQGEMQSVDGVKSYTSILQVESFAITNNQSKGVLIKGVNASEFQQITQVKLPLLDQGVVIGKKFSENYKLKKGDSLVLALASSKSKNQGSAILEEFQIEGVVEHGIYEKDMRFIYMDKRTLEELLNYKEDVSNTGLIKIKNFENIQTVIRNLKHQTADHFRYNPFWSEFEVLLDAVKIEKHSISLVLQLIVIVAIINIVAFIIYISEIKAQDFFMLRALGLSIGHIQKFWFTLLFLIWGISSVICIGFKEIFVFILAHVPYLKIPGDIYVLSELKVILDPLDYFYVYGISLLWVLLIGFFIMRKLKQSSVLAGLRQEFS